MGTQKRGANLELHERSLENHLTKVVTEITFQMTTGSSKTKPSTGNQECTSIEILHNNKDVLQLMDCITNDSKSKVGTKLLIEDQFQPQAIPIID